MIFVYTTCPDMNEAKRISRDLIEKKLISCANFFLCSSMYASEKEPIETDECIFLGKTEDVLLGEVRDRILEIHPYELPVVGCVSTDLNEEYDAWMERYLK